MPPSSGPNEPPSSIFFAECQTKLIEPENIVTYTSTYMQTTKLLTSNSCQENYQITSSHMTQLSDKIPLTFVKTTHHP